MRNLKVEIKTVWSIIGIVFSICFLIFVNSINVYATDIFSKNETIERIQKDIDKLNILYGPETMISIDYDRVDQEFIDYVESMSDDELYDYLKALYDNNRIRIVEPNPNLKESYRSVEKIYRGGNWSQYTTRSGICRFSTSIPALGSCQMNITYSAVMKMLSSTNTWYIDNVSVGTSYQTGLAMATWTHVSSSVKKANYETYATITIKGVMTYPIPKIPFSYSADMSFEYCLRANEIMG